MSFTVNRENLLKNHIKRLEVLKDIFETPSHRKSYKELCLQYPNSAEDIYYSHETKVIVPQLLKEKILAIYAPRAKILVASNCRHLEHIQTSAEHVYIQSSHWIRDLFLGNAQTLVLEGDGIGEINYFAKHCIVPNVPHKNYAQNFTLVLSE